MPNACPGHHLGNRGGGVPPFHIPFQSPHHLCPCLPRSVIVSINLGLTYMNYSGLHVVGNAAVGMTVLTLAPFVVMAILGEGVTWVCGPMWGEAHEGRGMGRGA